MFTPEQTINFGIAGAFAVIVFAMMVAVGLELYERWRETNWMVPKKPGMRWLNLSLARVWYMVSFCKPKVGPKPEPKLTIDPRGATWRPQGKDSFYQAELRLKIGQRTLMLGGVMPVMLAEEKGWFWVRINPTGLVQPWIPAEGHAGDQMTAQACVEQGGMNDNRCLLKGD